MTLLSQSDWIIFFLQLAIMLAAAVVGGFAMRRLGQPVVVGELIAGILLGPTLFGTLAPTTYDWLFPAQGAVAVAREAVIGLGMLFFLFVAGLEVNLRWLQGKASGLLLTSSLGLLVPFVLGFAGIWFFPEWWGAIAQQQDIILAIFIGTILSISALPVIMRILLDLKLLDKEIGVLIVSAATADDLIGWAVFAALVGNADRNFTGSNFDANALFVSLGIVLVIFVFLWYVGSRILRPVMQRALSATNSTGNYISILTIVLLMTAALVETIGIHPTFGALLTGVALGQGEGKEKASQAHAILHHMAISFFAPLYFVSVGLKANFATYFDLRLVIFVIVIATIGKVGGAGLGAWLGGLPWRKALAVGAGLNARGAMAIILASEALQVGLIDSTIFVTLVIMAVITSLISGPLVQRLMVHENNWG